MIGDENSLRIVVKINKSGKFHEMKSFSTNPFLKVK